MFDISELQNFFQFRNPNAIGPVVIQCFMLLAAVLIILGLIYVFLLVLAMAIHHVLFDRDPKKIPDYVKKSIQFSSESEDSDTENPRSKKKSGHWEVKSILHRVKRSDNAFSGEDEEFDEGNNVPVVQKNTLTKRPTLSMGAQRTNNLDKFMGMHIDVNKS